MSDDFSQSGEQALILDALAACGIQQGRFLDIGAGDGVMFSNTRALAEAGWGGVAVEPAAWAFDRLVDLYADSFVQPCCAIVTPAVGGLQRFAYSKDDLVSSVDDRHIETWKGEVPYRWVTAAAVPIWQLLDWFELGAQFVSIDAEGLTTELVKAYAQHPAWHAVKVICFERDPGPAMQLQAWQGWELVGKTPNNVVYRRAV